MIIFGQHTKRLYEHDINEAPENAYLKLYERKKPPKINVRKSDRRILKVRYANYIKSVVQMKVKAKINL